MSWCSIDLLDGEWLLDDNGNKIKAVGTDGADGANGQDGVDGVDGESLIESIDIGNDSVTFTLTNGQVITIPLGESSDNRENNKIYYTTTDGKKIFPYDTDPNVWGAYYAAIIEGYDF